jgi:prevent-host-death family protein
MRGAQRVDLGRVEILTMRELTQHTARVIEQVRKEGRPRAVVKHGRFQASLWPLEDGFESWLLAKAVSAGDLVVDLSGEGRSVDDLIAEETSMEGGGASPAGEDLRRHPDQIYGTVSMTEFNQATSAVIERVRGGQRLIITRRGRYLALLAPLPKNLASLLLATAPEFLRTIDAGKDGEVGRGFPVEVIEALSDS